MTEREKLIETIKNIRRTFAPDSFQNERLADFILADRKRICAPLVEHKKRIINIFGINAWGKSEDVIAIDSTLTLAGIETT